MNICNSHCKIRQVSPVISCNTPILYTSTFVGNSCSIRIKYPSFLHCSSIPLTCSQVPYSSVIKSCKYCRDKIQSLRSSYIWGSDTIRYYLYLTGSSLVISHCAVQHYRIIYIVVLSRLTGSYSICFSVSSSVSDSVNYLRTGLRSILYKA